MAGQGKIEEKKKEQVNLRENNASSKPNEGFQGRGS